MIIKKERMEVYYYGSSSCHTAPLTDNSGSAACCVVLEPGTVVSKWVVRAV
jgi:hypothetical protein